MVLALYAIHYALSLDSDGSTLDVARSSVVTPAVFTSRPLV